MALLEFRSKAAGGFFMMPDTFKTVCKVLGRPYSESGSLPPEDIPAAIRLLEQEIETERIFMAEQEKKRAQKEREGRAGFMTYEEEEEERKLAQRVSFRMRVFPLMDMLQAAAKKGVPVMWGVP